MTSHFHFNIPTNATAQTTTANQSTAGPGWEKNVQTEPDGEVQDHADDRSGDGGMRGGEFFVAAQLLDVTANSSLPD